MLLNKAATSECIVQDKIYRYGKQKAGVKKDARAFFTRIEKNLSTNLFALGSKCEPLNATDRLKIFHNFYRAGSEENFNLDFELLQNQGMMSNGLYFSRFYGLQQRLYDD